MKPLQIIIFLPTFEHQRPKTQARRATATRHQPLGDKHK